MFKVWDKDALIQNIVMIVAFVAAVDGCALYSLKRSTIRPKSLRLLWAAIILLLPAVGALAFFFLRGVCGSESVALEEDGSPIGSGSYDGRSPASASGESGEPTTPRMLQELQLQGVEKSPAMGGSPTKWMFAPSS